MKLYSFYWNCGRVGDVEGVFVSDDETLEKYYGSEVYFGEILGKHSEICGTLDRDDIEVLSDDEEKIEWLVSVTGGDYTISGYNPLSYLSERE